MPDGVFAGQGRHADHVGVAGGIDFLFDAVVAAGGDQYASLALGIVYRVEQHGGVAVAADAEVDYFGAVVDGVDDSFGGVFVGAGTVHVHDLDRQDAGVAVQAPDAGVVGVGGNDAGNEGAVAVVVVGVGFIGGEIVAFESSADKVGVVGLYSGVDDGHGYQRGVFENRPGAFNACGGDIPLFRVERVAYAEYLLDIVGFGRFYNAFFGQFFCDFGDSPAVGDGYFGVAEFGQGRVGGCVEFVFGEQVSDLSGSCAKLEFDQQFVVDVAYGVSFFVVGAGCYLFAFYLRYVALVAEIGFTNQGFAFRDFGQIGPGVDHVDVEVAIMAVVGDAVVGDAHPVKYCADAEIGDVLDIYRDLFVGYTFQHLGLDAGLGGDLFQYLAVAGVVGPERDPTVHDGQLDRGFRHVSG